jgi:hypothetical protein
MREREREMKRQIGIKTDGKRDTENTERET